MDLTETKRVRRDLDVDNVRSVYGCYVCAGQIVARMSIPVLDLSNVLEKQNIPDDKVEKLREVIAEELVPINLVSKKYEIKTDDTVITTEPENALMIKTREIDGRKYILIPANGRITVNGQDVFFDD